jgi:hypothetical protein
MSRKYFYFNHIKPQKKNIKAHPKPKHRQIYGSVGNGGEPRKAMSEWSEAE